MRKPYFLTRQTANLMEDFVRDLNSGGSVYLLYGEEGVGKTRLLEELVQSRLQDSEVRWIDLKAGGSGEGALVDSSVLIEDTFARANSGDVIIADHFEMALKKSRHQLYLSWSTDGADKQINLIIAGNTSYYDELRQLAQQYQLRAQSFQMMPFSPNEATAFLGSYLFPDRPIGKLRVPSLLRNQIGMAQGSVGRIIEIAERAGDQISSEPSKDTGSTHKGSRVTVGVLIAVSVILVGVWYFLGSSVQMFFAGSTELDEMPITRTESSIVTQAPVKSSPDPAMAGDNKLVPATTEGSVEKTTDKVDGDTGDSQSAPQGVQQDGVGEELAIIDEPELDTDINSEAGVEVQTVTDSVDEHRATTPAAVEVQAIDAQEQAAGKDSDLTNAAHTESTSEQTAIAGLLPSIQSLPGRLLQDLQDSLEWIKSRDSSVGTLQIMLLSQNRFDDRTYYKHLDRLSERGIDISKVRIFATYTGDQKVFSVVFGEYLNRGAANAATKSLPAILQDSAPIGRSVGGLMEEIQRLEGKN